MDRRRIQFHQPCDHFLHVSRTYPDFSSPTPKLLTYHSAKGLTFDTVLLPRVVGGSFERRTEAQALRMMFVAVTRAARWVYISTVAGQEPEFLSRLEPLTRAGELTRRGGDEPAAKAAPTAPAAVDTPTKSDWTDEIFT